MSLQVLSEALAKASSLLDVVACRASGGKKLQPRKPKTRRMSGRRNTWMRAINPTFREEIHLDPDVNPIIAREHQIFNYRLELLGNYFRSLLQFHNFLFTVSIRSIALEQVVAKTSHITKASRLKIYNSHLVLGSFLL
jgi:hypothetical protein